MRQLGITRGLGIGANTAAVVEGGQVEIVGDEGVLLIDLSGSRGESGSAEGFHLAGARLSYLEHGDRFDMQTLEVEPAAAKRDGFEIDPDADDRQPLGQSRPVFDDLFVRGRLLQSLHEALDGPRREAFGFVFPEDTGSDGRGFRFHFHPRAETFGWLSRPLGHRALYDFEPWPRDHSRPTKGYTGHEVDEAGGAIPRYRRGLAHVPEHT